MTHDTTLGTPRRGQKRKLHIDNNLELTHLQHLPFWGNVLVLVLIRAPIFPLLLSLVALVRSGVLFLDVAYGFRFCKRANTGLAGIGLGAAMSHR